MTNYPLMNIFLSTLWFFLWMLWIFLVVRILMDVFASDDLNGWAKAGWTVLIIFLPLVGVLVYLIARGKSMRERQEEQITAQNEAFRAQVKEAAGSGTASELAKLADLHDRGALTDSEFEQQKGKILAS